MMTIFSVPKPFVGHINTIQRNAVKSWLSLKPNVDIILFGDEPGVEETAREFGITHAGGIRRNSYGTPLLSEVFAGARELARGEYLLYVNADIILFRDILEAAAAIGHGEFLAAGRRMDLAVDSEIDMRREDWEEELQREVRRNGTRHGYSGLDYFLFPNHLTLELPPFAVGRQGWDNWVIWRMRSLGIPVIDVTDDVTVIHQAHDYSHSAHGKKDWVGGPEVDENYRLAGGLDRMFSLRDADFLLKNGTVVRPPFPRSVLPRLSFFAPWQQILLLKRRLNSAAEKKAKGAHGA